MKVQSWNLTLPGAFYTLCAFFVTFSLQGLQHCFSLPGLPYDPLGSSAYSCRHHRIHFCLAIVEGTERYLGIPAGRLGAIDGGNSFFTSSLKVCVFNNLAAFYSQPEQAARVCAVVAR